MIYQLVTVIGVSVCVVLWIWKTKKINEQPPDFSGKLPLLGHLHQIFGDSVDMYQFLNKLTEESMAKGGVITFYLGNRQMYAVSDPEDCLTISNACLERDPIYQLGKLWLGNGLITSSGPIWKKHRKLLNPAFSQAVLNSFMGIFNSQARLLVEQFAAEIGNPFDHEKLLRLSNLETICFTSMGISGEEHKELREQYISLTSQFLFFLTERFKRFWLHSDLIFGVTKMKRELDEVVKSLMKLSNQMIQDKKAELKRNEKLNVKNNSEKIKPFMDLILDLTNDTGCFTDEEIREETDNIIVAGHDTSASILTFLFTLLGSHPHTQNKVYDEIMTVLGNADIDLDKDDLSKLVYTEAVVKETIRLYPTGPVIARYIDKEVKLKNYTAEANTGCLLLILGVHRHPMWGPDVDQFRPERWLDTASLPDPNYFGGFSLGRRSCIGKVYAMMSMKVTVAHVLRRYRISSDIKKMIIKWEVMTRPQSGHEITLELRNKIN